MSNLPRRIAHLDMDAFYASCEIMRYPQLRGLPVVIGGRRRREDDLLAIVQALQPEGDWQADNLSERLHHLPLEAFPKLDGYVGRGVITTATYEARQFGVGSAMGLMKAAQQCPQAILLPVDFERYRAYSRQFKAVITEIAPVMEDRGVDEVYMDFTEVPGGQREGGRVLARLIQKSIHQATGLTCSIGVAPNKLLAKMASEFHKPNGISVLHESDLESRIWPLPCRKINGIGPKAEVKLKALGIDTIGQLAALDRFELMETFGRSYGAWLFEAAWGRDDRPVQTESEPVGVSRETTFERDLHAIQDRDTLGRVFTRLCEQVADDLRRKGYVGRTVGIKLRYENFQSVTRDISVDEPTDDPQRIRQLAGQCLKRVDLQRRFRLLGVRVSSLMRADAWQAQRASDPQAGYGESESLF
ncbi:MAG: DNA polymerase IV [Alphaproteobacteria bacterium]|nr:DNA polymerase IV [Alphaproteobacteria bacterium]